MKIKKILNNNAVVVDDQGQEKIVMGGGISFEKGKNDIVDPQRIEKVFILEDQERYGYLQEMLQKLPEEEIAVSESIISYAEQELQVSFNEHIHIALTDHLSFALERLRSGMVIHNTLLEEIRLLYPAEFQIGLHARQLISRRLQIDIPEDEVGYIAMHIHTARMNAGAQATAAGMAAIMKDIVEEIEDVIDQPLDRRSSAYERLMSQLKSILQDHQQDQPGSELDPEIIRIAIERYSPIYEQVEEMSAQIEDEYGYVFTESQRVLIAIEVNRLLERLGHSTR
ncbi:PRD domain-containing protein [Paenibacillus bovis]|uniref:Levansucrase n=1 Tax=Paenibacillus bovis TaxID=1616788 RepID=A0A172ZG32_9BACL|nr:PRD domain-containing protein [Paenibacillus bovis]ANF96227.1 levansucrase [Paenibacillus bovis]